MATLNLISTTRNGILLKGEESGEELEYYSLDGEGGKATKTPVTPWNQEEEYLGVSCEYDLDDSDSFWSAQQAILKEAKSKGFEMPDYVEIY